MDPNQRVFCQSTQPLMLSSSTVLALFAWPPISSTISVLFAWTPIPITGTVMTSPWWSLFFGWWRLIRFRWWLFVIDPHGLVPRVRWRRLFLLFTILLLCGVVPFGLFPLCLKCHLRFRPLPRQRPPSIAPWTTTPGTPRLVLGTARASRRSSHRGRDRLGACQPSSQATQSPNLAGGVQEQVSRYQPTARGVPAGSQFTACSFPRSAGTAPSVPFRRWDLFTPIALSTPANHTRRRKRGTLGRYIQRTQSHSTQPSREVIC